MDDRTRKAGKISSILLDFCKENLKNLNCLDLGCSRGIITTQLAGIFKIVIGIDVDVAGVKLAQDTKIRPASSPYYILGSGYHIPASDTSFDVVVWAQVYEHVNNPAKMVHEIDRVLKPGGFCFFSGPNRLAIMEEHYWLPFLSWLPNSIASLYMKIMHRGNLYDAYPLTYWQLKRIWENFIVHDYTLQILREPRRFSVDERVEKYGLIKFVPDEMIKFLRPFYPNYNWIVVKKNE
jgi:2-polyprenyl-3-methyl-5-hydroxy-6-metoxy-1,4-benzoquinol methylase